LFELCPVRLLLVPRKREMREAMGLRIVLRTVALATVLLGMPSVGVEGFVLSAHPALSRVGVAALARPPLRCATGRPLLRRAPGGARGLLRMSEEAPDGVPPKDAPEEAPNGVPAGGPPPPEEEVLDPSTRVARAGEIRKQATELDKEAGLLRKEAVAKEQSAAKLRIQAWTIEGKVSAVTQEITLTDRYERDLVELDLMAKDWVDTDEDKWEWYQKQRTMLQQLIGAGKEYDAKAEASQADLKEILKEIQELLNINTVDENNKVTTTGWVFVTLSVVIPLYVGYEVFQFLASSSAAFFGGISAATTDDPFKGL